MEAWRPSVTAISKINRALFKSACIALLFSGSAVAQGLPADTPYELSPSLQAAATAPNNLDLSERGSDPMQASTIVRPGKSYPLGATWDGSGINFVVFSEQATLVQLCLFDKEDHEINRINIKWNDEGVWHCYLPQAKPGLRYGFRVHGPFNPSQGQFFNPDKLMLDPYAKQVSGLFQWNDALYSYQKGVDKASSKFDLRDNRDNAAFVPKSCVVNDRSFNWGDDASPNIPLNESIIYEVHVKGFSMRNPQIPEKLRGTYAGLGSPASIDYLRKLGITAVELLPVHFTLSEGRLNNMGLRNYWGYNTVGFFAPDPRFAASDDPVNEFKQMVKNLHEANIEVILDVVYNHTAEQGSDGPALCFRGLDNNTYYRMNPQDPGAFLDFTGCGNSVDTRRARTLQLTADSLRYWVQEMHVDGFRFDLVTTLARTGSSNSYNVNANFLSVLAQDPILSHVKLIAEPWDCGPGGYQLGHFPKGWSEWNGEWRDTMRRFWRGDSGLLGKVAGKLSGSSDLFWDRSPQASINFITCHDGYTLNDIVSYELKHNEANGENNRDGSNDNYSWNCGSEGPSNNNQVQQLRSRQVRNMLMTVLFSQGVPMLLGGDEIGRTQQGNNNAYCQDNDISYYNWNLSQEQKDLLAFTQKIIHLRREHAAFKRTTFFRGEMERPRFKDVLWLNSQGQEMADNDWTSASNNCLGMYIAGDCLEGTNREGWPLRDDSFLLILNGDAHDITFTLPQMKNWSEWQEVISSYDHSEHKLQQVSGSVKLPAHSAVLFREQPRRS